MNSTLLHINCRLLAALVFGSAFWLLDNDPALAAEPKPSGPIKPFAQSSKRWTNSLGQVFVPVTGTSVHFSIWHVRVQDFEAFTQATGHEGKKAGNWSASGKTWNKPGFAQTPLHPVCGVSWDDAKAFCLWLTEQERAAGYLTALQSYRLPTDLEWSAAVGLTAENRAAASPKERAGKVSGVYPWGRQWPPPKEAGNYREGGAVQTTPVGGVPANRYGLYDMGGNLAEWCEDWYGPEQDGRVMRGSPWNFNSPTNLLSSSRIKAAPNIPHGYRGFRCVVAESAKTNDAPPAVQTILAPSRLPTTLPPYILNPTNFAKISPLPPARRPYLNVLVRFRDSVGEPPHPREWYHRLITDPKVGVSQFYQGLSGGQVSLDGTQTTDWITLPGTRLAYCTRFPQSKFQEFDIAKLLPELANILKGTNFGAWFGIIIYTSVADGPSEDSSKSGNEGLGAWTSLPPGSTPYQFRHLSGQDSYPWAIIPPRGANLAVVAHEIGHHLGFQHTSGPYEAVYDSEWDFMSRGRNRANPDPEFGTSPISLCAYQLLKIGWLPLSRVYYADTGAHEVRLERLSAPTNNKDPLVVVIPRDKRIGHYYTVEARMFAGNDQKGGIPGEAVVIHDVLNDFDLAGVRRFRRRAQVVDADKNGNPNDEGAMWTKGKKFVDSVGGIVVSVLDRDATGFLVRIEVHRP